MDKTRSAVFLDRDGTLIEEANYLKNLEDLKIIKGTPEAVKKLNKNGILAIMVTNQSGVARGYFDEDNVKFLNKSLNSLLKKDGAYLDGFYYCPHHIKGIIDEYAKECDCRKPKAGLIQQALQDFREIDLKKSYVIGDKLCDIELAKNAGCRGILVKTGYGSQLAEEVQNSIKPDFIAETIEEAVNWLLQDLNQIF